MTLVVKHACDTRLSDSSTKLRWFRLDWYFGIPLLGRGFLRNDMSYIGRNLVLRLFIKTVAHNYLPFLRLR
jgi:hypothetical protein